MSQPRPPRDARILTIAILALLTGGCECVQTKATDFAAALGSISAACVPFAATRNTVANDGTTACHSSRAAGKHSAGAVLPYPYAEVETIVVRARIDADRQIVAADNGRSSLDTRVAVLARHMSPGMLSGTEITAVFGLERKQRAPGSKQLLALQVGNGIDAARAFYVRDEARRIDGFYTLDGRPVEKTFLRFPINHMFVSSPFSSRRTHPILKSRRPHLGVDLAAPRGTPVVAVANGEIIEATWSGALGRTVHIRHDHGYVTGYSHLEKFAPQIAAGVAVHKGQIIGYVGTSGLATGPHLHFSMLRHGSFVDPLATRLPRTPRLKPVARLRLQVSATRMMQTLAAATEPRQTEPTRIAARSRDN